MTTELFSAPASNSISSIDSIDSIASRTNSNRPSLFRAEMYKLTQQRTPRVFALVLAALLMIGPVYLLFKPPADAATYTEVLTLTFGVATTLIAAIFGAWFLGNEYRQGTIKRAAAVDARRTRLLSAKLVSGSIAIVAGIAAATALSLGATAIAASVNGADLVTAGLTRDLLAGVVYALIVTTITFGLTMILRSDVYATLVSIALMVMFAPLLELIPTIGKYMPSAAANRVHMAISGFEADPGMLSSGMAIALTIAYTAGVVLVGQQLFVRRDI